MQAARATMLVKSVPDDGFDRRDRGRSKAIDDRVRPSARALIDDEALGPQTTTDSVAAARGLRSTLRYALRFYYDAFEAFDLLLYPLEYGTVDRRRRTRSRSCGSARASAPGPTTSQPEARMLRGTTISHFGAFFDLEWRKHDMLWGRLNASESLIRSLCPTEHPSSTR